MLKCNGNKEICKKCTFGLRTILGVMAFRKPSPSFDNFYNTDGDTLMILIPKSFRSDIHFSSFQKFVQVNFQKSEKKEMILTILFAGMAFQQKRSNFLISTVILNIKFLILIATAKEVGIQRIQFQVVKYFFQCY